MASTHTNNAINLSHETKGTYESDCWLVNIYGDNTRFSICIRRYPTSAEHFAKWKVLMKTMANALSIGLCVAGGAKDCKSFNDHYIPLLCNMLKNNNSIASLLVWGVLNNIGMKSVCKALQTHSTLKTLLLKSHRFSESIGCDLEDLITLNKTLTILSVDITNEDMKFAAAALPHNSTLTSLGFDRSSYFAFDYVDNKGLRILCEGLKRNRSITTLELDGNHISDEGAKDLCSLLEVNHTITNINLSENRIVKLPEGFAFLTHIKYLDLTGNSNLHRKCGRLFVCISMSIV